MALGGLVFVTMYISSATGIYLLPAWGEKSRNPPEPKPEAEAAPPPESAEEEASDKK